MIHVRRGPCPEDLRSDGAQSVAAVEKAKAKRFYTARANAFKNYGFAVYRRQAVKTALIELFHDKCAYCETYFANSPIDVEHYRPKGGVVVDGHFYWPGYWWLAAEWTNLLPSCIDCNRSRWHPDPDEEDDGKKSKHGKENLFPLQVEDDRAGWAEDDEDAEKPLLLDPCRDRPETYLDFRQEAGGVEPRARLSGERLARAKQSIEIYGLKRQVLRRARSDRQTAVLGQTQKVMNAFRALRQQAGSAARRQTLANELRDLAAQCEPEKQYAAAARAFGDPLRKKIRAWLRANLDQSEAEFLAAHPATPLDRTPVQAFEAELAALMG